MRFPLLCLLVASLACSPATTSTPTTDGGATDAGLDLDDVMGPVLDMYGCDPIAPTVCGVPFPSNVYLVPDATRVTGYHVEIPQLVIPPSREGNLTDTTIFSRSDGFSAGSEAMIHLPGATTDGLPDPEHIADSVLADSPTVILDTVTGERVPHWSELDLRSHPTLMPAYDTPETKRLLLIRPAFRLEDNRRYIIAVRNVKDSNGVTIEPTEVFKALRDRERSPLSAVGGRRANYEDIFARLTTAGVERASLQIAWDFTTASLENNTRPLLHMRDTALAALGENTAPAYTITNVQENPQAHLARRIEGMLTVPMFLDKTTPGGRMTFDAQGLPVQQGTAEFPFIVTIPVSAAQGPLPLLHVGHGLFATREVLDDSRMAALADSQGVVMLGMDWLGLSNPDLPELGVRLASGDLSQFATVPDRGMQAMLNNILADRMVKYALATDTRTHLGGTPTIDPAQLWYWGASLGGIYGATFMSLTPDIPRGVLGVPGQSFDLMLPRSIHYDAFLFFMRDTFPDVEVYPVFLSLAAMIWDHCEPTGFSRHIVQDPLPGTRTHEVLLIDALRDRQVSTYAAHIMARAIGVPQVGPVRSIYGIETVTSPHAGSALVEIDYGQPPAPLINIPPDDTYPDTHGFPWEQTVVHVLMSHFLRDGEVLNGCSEGVCNPD